MRKRHTNARFRKLLLLQLSHEQQNYTYLKPKTLLYVTEALQLHLSDTAVSSFNIRPVKKGLSLSRF